MRQIKFRIWDGVKFGYWTPNTGSGEIAGWPKIVGEVQQFTGLTDKSGTLIYEGDILACYSQTKDTLREEKRELIPDDFVEYSEVKIPDFYKEIWARPDSLVEVIGNVYMNPELLEH